MTVSVRGNQCGWMNGGAGLVSSFDKMLSHEDGGPQITSTWLKVHEEGPAKYRAFSPCLDSKENLMD